MALPRIRKPGKTRCKITTINKSNTTVKTGNKLIHSATYEIITCCISTCFHTMSLLMSHSLITYSCGPWYACMFKVMRDILLYYDYGQNMTMPHTDHQA